VCSAKPYDRQFLDEANADGRHVLTYLETALDEQTVALATGADAVCVFVNDTVDNAVLGQLARYGVRAVALRCAGYNNVDLDAANDRGIRVVRVPAYSPTPSRSTPAGP
jgi:D-lactate dehydrogenase